MGMIVVNFVRRREEGGKFVVAVPRDGYGGDRDGDAVFILSNFGVDSHHERVLARWRNSFAGGAPDVRVEGGGWWRFHPDDNSLQLYGRSAAFGRFNAARLAASLAPGSVMGESSITFSDD